MAAESNKRWIALVLALVGPWGLGQFFLGRRLRAAFWFAIGAGGLLGGMMLLPALGPRIGWGGALVVPWAIMALAWLGSVADLFIVNPRDPSPAWQTALFAVGGVVTTVIVAFSIRIFLLEAFRVPGGSMSPTLLSGDHMLVDKRARSPDYGDVVVFANPENPAQDFVKRVIAKPGDVLDMKGGHPHVNGWRVPSCVVARSVTIDGETGQLEVEFLGRASYLVMYSSHAAPDSGPFLANDGYLVLGDNRNDSYDSRMWFGGAGGDVPPHNLRGRAMFIWLRQSASDVARFNVSLEGSPRLVSSLAAYESDLDRCLAARPKTTP